LPPAESDNRRLVFSGIFQKAFRFRQLKSPEHLTTSFCSSIIEVYKNAPEQSDYQMEIIDA